MTDWASPPLEPTTVDWESPQVASYKFRQDPGPHNALGLVRINMPNKHSVYMHDTPLKQLFSQSARAFSSGCVRVQKVLEPGAVGLAYLLAAKPSPGKKVVPILGGGDVKLAAP